MKSLLSFLLCFFVEVWIALLGFEFAAIEWFANDLDRTVEGLDSKIKITASAGELERLLQEKQKTERLLAAVNGRLDRITKSVKHSEHRANQLMREALS